MNDIELRSFMADIKQVALKNRVWYIGTIIIAVLAIVSALLYWHTNEKGDLSHLQLFNKERDALIDNNRSLKNLVEMQSKAIIIASQSDSNLIRQVFLNRENILLNRKYFLKSIKERKHEMDIINKYSPTELNRAVTEITRQYLPTE